jgi:uncharacterized protein YfaS (alpha-2-macroglobulin family)
MNYYGGYGQYTVDLTAPVDRDNLREHIRFNPAVSGLSVFLSGETSLYIGGYFEPETLYSVTLESSLQDVWGGRLGQDITNTFLTEPAVPALLVETGFTAYNMLFIPESASEIVLQATNINTVNFELSPISLNDLEMLIHPDNYDYRQMYLPENLETTTHSLVLDRNENNIVSLPLRYQGEPLTPGIYFLAVSTPDILEDEYQSYQKFYLVVSRNNLVMKIAPEQVFVWATHLEDFAPMGDAAVSIFTTEGDKVASGQTDSEGIFEKAFNHPEDSYGSFFAVVGEPGQSDFGFTISSWNQNYSLYEMGINLATNPPEFDVYGYTDRPIYRPGDTVYFKAAVFSRDNGRPISPEIDQVTVTIDGDPGLSGIPNQLYTEELALDSFGMVEGQMSLSEDANVGRYSINFAYGEVFIGSVSFEVAAYRKPEVEITLDLSESEINTSETISAQGQVNTYFGFPISNQTFSWNLYRKETDFHLPGYQVGPQRMDWLNPEFLGDSAVGELVSSGEGLTDDAGNFGFELSPEDFLLEDTTPGSTNRFTIEMSITNESGFYVSQRESFVVHPEVFYIGVQSQAYFGSVDAPFDFEILTVGWQQEPLGSLPLEATFESIEWEYQATGDPGYPYRFVPETSLVASASPVSGPDGRARLSFTPPDPGTYQLTVESGGSVTQVIVWVGGSGTAAWPRQSGKQVQLIPDEDDYQPGQIAQIFVPNPFSAGAKVLVTVERGEIMNSQVIEISGSGHVVSIPILDESIPNVYVSVMLLGRNESGQFDYRQGTVNLPVAPINKNLNVVLSVNPELTMPGDTVTAVLKISDQQGNPVQGAFSVAVVDKAVLALIETNRQPILDAFFGNQPLSILTGFSLQTYGVRSDLQAMDLGRGGGGGEGIEAVTVREEFPDTAFWRGDVITDRDGTAQLQIPLPDSLTTWVVSVVGLTESYLVGETQAEILTQKELMIQPVTPRFFVDGDEVELAAVVYNNTTGNLSVDVSLQAIGFSLDDDIMQVQTTELEPGKSERVAWNGKVESVESVDLVFQAVSGDLQDASAPLWGDLQVKRYVMPYTFSTAGQLSEAGQRLELVSLPISTDPSSGELSLILNPSLTSTLVESLAAMEAMPYEDTISILSRLLGNLNGYLALKDLGIDSPQLEKNLQSLSKTGINQLLEMQNFDGGWSWRAGSENDFPASDPFITAYVLIGLEQASQAGFRVGTDFVDRSIAFLSNHLSIPRDLSSSEMMDRLSFIVYALRNTNLRMGTTIDTLYEHRAALSPWALAMLSLSLNDVGGRDAQVQTLLSDLEARAVRSATGVYWESSNISWILPGTINFNTAVVSLALSHLDPASVSLSPALQYMLVNRKGENLGGSSFETAWMLMALTQAMKGTGDYQADFDFKSTLNDVVIAEGGAEGVTTYAAVRAFVPIDYLYPDAPNALVIERDEGSGTLYYRVDLNTYQPASSAEAINKGIEITRDYYIYAEGCPGNPGCEQIDRVGLLAGEQPPMITAALTIIIPQDMVNVILEDFIPAGTEIVNRRFLTTQIMADETGLIYDPRHPFDEGWGWWYFNQPKIYDDHIVWTADTLPAGTYTLTYELYPYQKGVYQVLPAHAWQYFYPEIQGTSAGSLFTID